MESQHIIPNSIRVFERTAEVLRQPGAKIVIEMAMAHKDAMVRRSHRLVSPRQIASSKYWIDPL